MINEFNTNGRPEAHKVTVLITTAGWETVGSNPYKSITDVKNLGEFKKPSLAVLCSNNCS